MSLQLKQVLKLRKTFLSCIRLLSTPVETPQPKAPNEGSSNLHSSRTHKVKKKVNLKIFVCILKCFLSKTGR